ncbi:MAG: Holliday junction branch migration DNA helicase RuvB, partial [Erysipelotrichaceae bacterium]|nr:Holliday junction branch migration DNA helicase RuvB [Erysipelotrichaceae bacterium]
MTERLMSSEFAPSDEEIALRPQTLDEYVGQDEFKANLRIFIQAARDRNVSLVLVLLFGP